MTWIMILIGLWVLSKVFEGSEAESSSRYYDNRHNYYSEPSARTAIDEYMQAIDAHCAKKTVGLTVGFVQTCVALQMAKADGVITIDELRAIKDSMLEAFEPLLTESDLEAASQLNKKYLANVPQSEIAKLAGAMVKHLFSYVSESFENEDEREQLLAFILTLPYEVALADGHVTREETKLFDAICEALEIDQETRSNIKRTAEFQWEQKANHRKRQQDQLGLISEALRLFGLKPGFTDHDLKEAWRQFAKINHPDRFYGIDPTLHTQLNERFQKGAAARDLILKNLAHIQTNPDAYFS